MARDSAVRKLMLGEKLSKALARMCVSMFVPHSAPNAKAEAASSRIEASKRHTSSGYGFYD
jgi:hypothetical protein